MKRRFFVPALIGMVVTGIIAVGCLKGTDATPCTPRSVDSEKTVMTKYATDSSITVTTDPSGLMYEVINPGTGATPTATSTVKAKYVGRFMTGQQFDASTGDGATFPLNGVISGWQIGIPKIKAGGIIKMIIPSSLAYGCTGYYTIPANQPLYFYVELVSVTN